MVVSEETIWSIIEPNDLWVLDKLILSRYLGYSCGPIGTPVPSPGEYIVRPVINALGMGISAEILFLEGCTDNLKPGHFWCEVFKGKHNSYDFYRGNQILAVEGIKADSRDLVKWDKWIRVDSEFALPSFLKILSLKYDYLNVETVDGNIIEVHFRANPDFWHSNSYPASEVIPVWKLNKSYIDNMIDQGYDFILDEDYRTMGIRFGILVKY